MMVYLGQTRAAAWIAALNSYGFGECTTRSEFPPRRLPFFFDNGAFLDHQRGRPFQTAKFEAALAKLKASGMRPDFLVVPDLVAQGHDSLRFSLSWVDRLKGLAPLYLVVQDGMGEEISRELNPFDGVFIGGSAGWKWRTAAQWIEFAHDRGMRCHIGRAGTENTCRRARQLGADSIDSSTPLWAEANFRRFLRGFTDTNKDLFG
jgi:hypothetical protein